MSSVEQHYDQHLAEHYSWLFGGLPERTRENRELFEKLRAQVDGHHGVAELRERDRLEAGARADVERLFFRRGAQAELVEELAVLPRALRQSAEEPRVVLGEVLVVVLLDGAHVTST